MDNFEIEDAFVSNNDGWIVLPSGEGKVSPNGIVYDKDGNPLYSIYEDSEQPINIYLEDEEYEEWARS